MANRRKPSNVLELKGSFKKNPSRARERANEPKPVEPIEAPPAGMPPDVHAAWVRLVSHAHEGTLCHCDSDFMLYAAGIWAELRAQIMAGKPIDLKLGVRFESIIARLGMSPADRSRVSVIKPSAEKSPHAEFG